MRMTIIGDKAMQVEIAAITKRMPKESRKALQYAGAIVIGEVQKQIQGSRTKARLQDQEPFISKKVTSVNRRGRTVTKYKKAGSLPNNKLGNLTGQLRKSIGSRGSLGIYRFGTSRRAGRLLYYLEIGTKVKYARVHEEGLPKRIYPTKAARLYFRVSKKTWVKARSVKTVKRPYMAPGVRLALPKAQLALGRAIRVIR